MDIRLDSAQGLTILATDSADGDIFATFYAGYDQAFTLPEEKESWDGFVDCLALNHGSSFERISSALGKFRELILVAQIDGETVGGANIFFAALEKYSVVTANLNYLYVLPRFRGRGLLRRLVDACREAAELIFPGAGPLLTFLELNDPLLLTAQQYAQDSAVAGIDQFDRVVVWARLGVRIVDFPYVQPSLSDTQQADRNLMLGLLPAPIGELTGELLAAHLERFFAISVLKTADVTTNSLAAAEVDECRRLGAIALLDPNPAIDRLRREIGTAGPGFRERLARLPDPHL